MPVVVLDPGEEMEERFSIVLVSKVVDVSSSVSSKRTPMTPSEPSVFLEC